MIKLIKAKHIIKKHLRYHLNILMDVLFVVLLLQALFHSKSWLLEGSQSLSVSDWWYLRVPQDLIFLVNLSNLVSNLLGIGDVVYILKSFKDNPSYLFRIYLSNFWNVILLSVLVKLKHSPSHSDLTTKLQQNFTGGYRTVWVISPAQWFLHWFHYTSGLIN